MCGVVRDREQNGEEAKEAAEAMGRESLFRLSANLSAEGRSLK